LQDAVAVTADASLRLCSQIRAAFVTDPLSGSDAASSPPPPPSRSALESLVVCCQPSSGNSIQCLMDRAQAELGRYAPVPATLTSAVASLAEQCSAAAASLASTGTLYRGDGVMLTDLRQSVTMPSNLRLSPVPFPFLL
jgi:hypothetical protein